MLIPLYLIQAMDAANMLKPMLARGTILSTLFV